jgi:hypothetical protein
MKIDYSVICYIIWVLTKINNYYQYTIKPFQLQEITIYSTVNHEYIINFDLVKSEIVLELLFSSRVGMSNFETWRQLHFSKVIAYNSSKYSFQQYRKE